MPSPGREALSSRLTLLLQLAPMLVWLVVVYFLIWIVLHQIFGAHTALAGRFGELLVRVVIFLLVIPFLALPVLALWAAGLRSVAMEDGFLIVGLGYGRTTPIPFAQIALIQEWRGPDVRTVRVTFTEKTRAGRSVRFLAPTRYTVPKDEAHPVVQALRESVDRAKARQPA